MTTNANLSTVDFELALERSFILFLRNAVPYIYVNNKQVPVQFHASIPYEQYEDARLTGCVCSVDIGQIRQEGWMIGTELPQNHTSTNTTPDYYSPFRYVLQFSINAFSGSSIDRAKLDGAILNALQVIQHTGIPVYSFSSEVTSATASDTGCRITLPSINMITRNRTSDINNHDFLTNWTIDARCIYVYETITQTVTTVSVSSDIVNKSTGEVFPTPTNYLAPVLNTPITAITDPNTSVNINWSSFVSDPQSLPLSISSYDSTSTLGGSVSQFSPTVFEYTPPLDVALETDTFDITITNGHKTLTTTVSVDIRDF